MDRRTFVSSLSALGISGLAGCNNENTSEANSSGTPTDTIETASDGPPYFERVDISGADTVEIGEEVTLEISALNTGGRDGDFTTTLTVGDGFASVDQGIRIPDVPRGGRKSTEIGPISFDYAQSLTFRITDYAARHELTIEPKRAGIGEQVSVGDLSASFDILGHQDSFFYQYTPALESESTTGLYYSDPGSVLTAVQISAENTSSETVPLDPSAIRLGERTPLTTSLPDNIESSLIGGETIADGSIPPNSSARGWLLFEADRTALSSGPTLSWDLGGSSAPDLIWDSEDGPALPEFHYERVTFPSELETGQDGKIELKIRNTGDAKGTFRGIVERRNVGENSWHLHTRVYREIPPGQTAEMTVTMSEPFVGPSQYRFLPAERSETIDFVPPVNPFGHTYVEPDGTAYTVRVMAFSDTYTTDGYDNPTYEADGTFAFIEVRAKNTVSEPNGSYAPQFFSAIVDGVSYDPVSAYNVIDPVSGPKYTGAFELSPGESTSGWVVYDVPSGTSRSDLEIQLYRDFSLTVEAYWRDE